jgi:histidinol-phosphate phosphatase family protein
VAPEEAGRFQQQPRGLAFERLGLWSDEAPPLEPDVTHGDVEILERACERALARHRSRALRAALFLDRDGTLVREIGYLADPDDLELLPGVPAALRAARNAGLPLVLISNQSGVGRGLFPLARVYEAMARLRQLLRAEGIELDAIYFCPHRPDGGCSCRKPGTALLERAAEDLLIALRRSAMAGDKLLDALTAHRAGALGILVRTGYGRDEEQRIAAAREAGEAPPDQVTDDLGQAVRWFLERLAEHEATG